MHLHFLFIKNYQNNSKYSLILYKRINMHLTFDLYLFGILLAMHRLQFFVFIVNLLNHNYKQMKEGLIEAYMDQ